MPCKVTAWRGLFFGWDIRRAIEKAQALLLQDLDQVKRINPGDSKLPGGPLTRFADYLFWSFGF
jgi:hypothetical protein